MFYQEQRRQKYLKECSNDYGDFSYYTLTADDFNGEDILVDKLKKHLCYLPKNEHHLIDALFTMGLSKREWSAQTSIPQKTINGRKHRLLTKLRKIF